MGARTMVSIAFCLLLACCGRDEAKPDHRVTPNTKTTPHPLSVPDDAPVVAFLGDSLAAGMRLSPHQSFPAALQRQLAAQGKPFVLVNAGVSGDTTSGGVGRVDWLLKRQPNIVVVELGANDGFRGIAPEVSEKNLRTIITKVQSTGAKVLLLGMKMPPNYGEDYARDFEAMYRRIAKDTGVAFVPFFLEGVAGIAEMNLDDGIHPTAAGHERAAQNLLPHLKPLLTR